MHWKLGLLTLSISLAILPHTFATNHSKNWETFSSCINMTQQFKSLMQNKNLQEEPLPTFTPPTALIDEGENPESTSFFTDYDDTTKTLLLIQGPVTPQNTLINLDKAKIFAKIRLPKNFIEVQTRIFKDRFLIIAATHLHTNGGKESIVLHYEIGENKLSPVHSFKQQGTLKYLKLQNEKLYLITAGPLSLEEAKAAALKSDPSSTIFPTTDEGISYQLPATIQNKAGCQDFKYFFNGELPHIWSITIIDLNRITEAKDHLYFLGKIEQLHFAKDFLYLSAEASSGETIIHRLGLEPKINYQKTETISGKLLEGGIITQGSKSSFITKCSSGKLKSYHITSFNEQFKAESPIQLLQNNEDYSSAEYHSPYLFLSNPQQGILIAKENGKLDFSSITGMLIPEGHQHFLLKNEPFSFLTLKNITGSVELTTYYLGRENFLEEKEKKQYSITGEIIDTPFRDKNQKLLFLPIKYSKGDQIFQGIQGLQRTPQETLKELFSRNYRMTNLNFRSLKNTALYAYTITENLIDIFLPKTSTKMKVLKRSQ